MEEKLKELEARVAELERITVTGSCGRLIGSCLNLSAADGMADIADSKPAASDSVPVRVRGGRPIFCCLLMEWQT